MDRSAIGTGGRKKLEVARSGSSSPVPERLGGNLSVGTSHSNSSPSLRTAPNRTSGKSPSTTSTSLSTSSTRSKRYELDIC